MRSDGGSKWLTAVRNLGSHGYVDYCEGTRCNLVFFAMCAWLWLGAGGIVTEQSN